MALVGYARVSTHEQNLDLQLDALTQACVEQVYTEHASGRSAAKIARPELDHCLRALRPGDTLLVWRLDRLGRNLHDLIRIINDPRSPRDRLPVFDRRRGCDRPRPACPSSWPTASPRA